MDEASVDAVVCDAPYEIAFMGKGWDQAGVAFDPATWREALRVLKPGGHLLAFGGTRTFHRLTCAIEDAGFEIRDCLSWNYGSGFPKSLNVSLAIDKANGASDRGRAIPTASTHLPSGRYAEEKLTPNPVEGYEARSPDAEQWEGWGTALKPAWEPIVMARKPLIGTVAKNVITHGTGGLNIDACRIDASGGRPAREIDPKPEANGAVYAGRREAGSGFDGGSRAVGETTEGRWPANFLLAHSEDCVRIGERRVKGAPHLGQKNPELTKQYGGGVFGGGQVKPDGGYADEDGLETTELWACVPGCPVRMLDDQSGQNTGGAGKATGPTMGKMGTNGIWNSAKGERVDPPFYGDLGGASRFFYCAKASRAERNAGLEGFDKKPLHRSSGDQSPGTFQAEGTERAARNFHPTVKSIDVMRWLVRLVTPPGGTILDPFAGSGTTGIAATLEGFDFIGVEKEADYVSIAEARIAWWAQYGEGAATKAILASARKRAKVRAEGQTELDVAA